MKRLTRLETVEYEGRRYQLTFLPSGALDSAYRIDPRGSGLFPAVDMVPLAPTDPLVAVFTTYGVHGIAPEVTVDPDTARFREALENLAKADASGFDTYGSDGARMMADSLHRYIRTVLDGGKGTP